MVTELELFETPDLIPLDFCLWGWMNTEIYTRRFTQSHFGRCRPHKET